jgi:hypothetical protein
MENCLQCEEFYVRGVFVQEEVIRSNSRKRVVIKQLIQRAAHALCSLGGTRFFRRKMRRTTSFISEPCEQNFHPAPKPYDKPAVRKLNLEQARLIVLGHSTLGDPGAHDLMPFLFTENSWKPLSTQDYSF